MCQVHNSLAIRTFGQLKVCISQSWWSFKSNWCVPWYVSLGTAPGSGSLLLSKCLGWMSTKISALFSKRLQMHSAQTVGQMSHPHRIMYWEWASESIYQGGPCSLPTKWDLDICDEFWQWSILENGIDSFLGKPSSNIYHDLPQTLQDIPCWPMPDGFVIMSEAFLLGSVAKSSWMEHSVAMRPGPSFSTTGTSRTTHSETLCLCTLVLQKAWCSQHKGGHQDRGSIWYAVTSSQNIHLRQDSLLKIPISSFKRQCLLHYLHEYNLLVLLTLPKFASQIPDLAGELFFKNALS